MCEGAVTRPGEPREKGAGPCRQSARLAFAWEGVQQFHMLVEEFEQIASAAPETVTLEFVNGRIEEKRGADGSHGTVVMWLLRQCMQSRPDLNLFPGRGLKVGAAHDGRALPDGVLAPVGHFAGHGEWSEPDGVLMAVEVTSSDDETNSRDRQEKPAAYAAAGIPIHLLIDRDSGEAVVHINPDQTSGCYRDVHRAPFGEQVLLPDPVGFTLDTEVLKNYVR